MKHDLNTKAKKGIAIAAAAVVVAAGIVAVCMGVINSRDRRSAETISYEPYRRLYAMKKTSLTDTEQIGAMVDLTAYYRENAKVLRWEQTTEDDDKQGLVFELEETSIYPLQSKECRQQATVLLTLIPKLDFAEYRINGETYRRYQQYGEDSGGKIYVTDDDQKCSDNVRNSEAFVAFMERIRPSCESRSVHEAVGLAVLTEYNGKFSGGEFGAEGHSVVSLETVNGKSEACVVMTYGSYRFINGNFVRIDGKKMLPAVFTFSANDNGNYMLEHIDFAVAGIKYEDAVKEMFVKETANRVLENHESLVQQLESQEKQQAQDYLKQLGRTGTVGKFSDFPTEYLSEKGVSDEAANAILANDKLLSYPMWIGTQEFLEDGKRFVYETSFREGSSEVVLKKYDYKTHETVEEFKVSATDGSFVG